MLQKTGIAIALGALGLAAAVVHAQEEEKSPHSIGGNMTFVTNYVARGVSQANFKPALQGSLEYGHASGFYAGFFGSNVSWLADAWEPAAPGVNSAVYGGVTADVISKSLEIDLYAGYRNTFLGDFSYDLGVLGYFFPGEYQLDTTTFPGLSKPTTYEVYGGLGWKWITAKLWYTVSDSAFMVGDARGTYYANVAANVPIGETGFNLYGHVGMWNWNGNVGYLKPYGLTNDIYDLTDWKIGATKDWLGFTFGLFYTGSTADKTVATAPGTNPAGGDQLAAWGNRFGENIGDDSIWLQITKSF
jgi:uncharacterized protein (TIGR02001 family)